MIKNPSSASFTSIVFATVAFLAKYPHAYIVENCAKHCAFTFNVYSPSTIFILKGRISASKILNKKWVSQIYGNMIPDDNICNATSLCDALLKTHC